MKHSDIIRLAKAFQKLAVPHVWDKGKDYILQKEDGTLVVGGLALDRDALNAMNSWQDLVDMGVNKGIVGEIAREYGGHPKNVDVWLEQNSRPYTEELEPAQEESVEKELFDIVYDLIGKAKKVAGNIQSFNDLALGKIQYGDVWFDIFVNLNDTKDPPFVQIWPRPADEDDNEYLQITFDDKLNAESVKKVIPYLIKYMNEMVGVYGD